MTTDRVFSFTDGARNFRELGGYETSDGHRVKWGRLYRAGILGTFSDDDCASLEALGLRSICDLRSTVERDRGPSQWLQMPNVSYWTRDYAHSSADLYKLMSSDLSTVEDARAAMVQIYRIVPIEQAPSYRELFRLLADGQLPLVFNCSAGKDRTGVAAALLLTVLNVPYETVLEDYMLSNTTFTVPREYRATLKCSPEVSETIRGTHPSFLAAAFTKINEEHGSVATYLRDRLQVTDAMLMQIRGHLLEPAT